MLWIWGFESHRGHTFYNFLSIYPSLCLTDVFFNGCHLFYINDLPVFCLSWDDNESLTRTKVAETICRNTSLLWNFQTATGVIGAPFPAVRCPAAGGSGSGFGIAPIRLRWEPERDARDPQPRSRFATPMTVEVNVLIERQKQARSSSF